MNGAHDGQILESHLRRAVCPDLDAGMGPAQPDVGRGDGRHPNEVVSTRQERAKGCREWDVTTDSHPDSSCDHLLLGDEHLEIPLGVHLGEFFGVGGVAHLPVQDDHVRTAPDRLQGLAESHPRGNLVAYRIAG